jgi:hypothetical protein
MFNNNNSNNLKERATPKELIKSYKRIAKKITTQSKSASIENNQSNFKESKTLSPWENVKTLTQTQMRKRALKLLINKENQPTEKMRQILYMAIKLKLKPDIFSNNKERWLLLTKKEAQKLINNIPYNDLKKIEKAIEKESSISLAKKLNTPTQSKENYSIPNHNSSLATAHLVESTITSLAQSLEQGMEI